ncbi:MAG: UDP-N-acetylmuramoyl-L-alanine--D-glutamate ligase [Tannerellaceae bacterium]|jgi:UDP-N-acetylmuramoylalanine--D-glutamate ligase|nr:UDP-N-acetylmuramoyl-L-alanine--D-glutamate ligase [Tannerellaceae bacterium]
MKKRIVVLGGGESGTGAAILAQDKGFDTFLSDCSVISDKYRNILDRHRILYEDGRHTDEAILTADEVIKSPGIPDKAPIIQALHARHISIISEIEFAARYTDAPMICITGSNGKTTTTLLTYHILRRAGMSVGLAGNVGHSLARLVAEEPAERYVIELSSFQLDNMYDFRADIAILTNITPDHLDRYHYNFQEYIDAKFRILRNQTPASSFIYWNGDSVVSAQIPSHPTDAARYPYAADAADGLSAYAAEGQMVVCAGAPAPFVFPLSRLSLVGTHNLYNALAAATAARLSGVPDEAIADALADFPCVPHRLETVATVDGVTYINDSKATNIDSCRYAVDSVVTPLILILGGTDKGNDYTDIAPLIAAKARALIFLGVNNDKLHTAFDALVPATLDARSMPEAIAAARRLAQSGDTVLLSPCCASFDLFRNYEDRGDQFRHIVRSLI